MGRVFAGAEASGVVDSWGISVVVGAGSRADHDIGKAEAADRGPGSTGHAFQAAAAATPTIAGISQVSVRRPDRIDFPSPITMLAFSVVVRSGTAIAARSSG